MGVDFLIENQLNFYQNKAQAFPLLFSSGASGWHACGGAP